MNPSILRRLEGLAERLEEVGTLLGDPEIIGDQTRFRALSREYAELGPVVESNTAPLGTAYMTPLDHRSSKTGITAEERALTIRTIADPASTPAQISRSTEAMAPG